MSEDMPDRMSDRMREDMPDRMPEDLPDRMPEDMPEDMPEHMPEDIPDRMPDRMPEDRMAEDFPVRRCINVMVGIIRSEVIVLFFAIIGWSPLRKPCKGRLDGWRLGHDGNFMGIQDLMVRWPEYIVIRSHAQVYV